MFNNKIWFKKWKNIKRIVKIEIFSHMDKQLTELRKVELHLHLDGAIRHSTLLELAQLVSFNLFAKNTSALKHFLRSDLTFVWLPLNWRHKLPFLSFKITMEWQGRFIAPIQTPRSYCLQM